MARMLGFEFEYDANSGARKAAANSREDRRCGGARGTERGGNYADRGVEDASGECYSRSVQSGSPRLWREPRPGVGREACRDGRISGDVAPDRPFAKQ